MRNPLEMRDLEAFIAVSETGSFTSAAQVLLLTQPTVSARIASLEASLDTKLLDRGPGGVKPTPAGAVLLEHARRLVRAREETVEALHQFLGKPGGTLLVGASSIPGSYLLPSLLAQLRRAHPRIRVRLEVSDTEKAVAGLRRGDFEVAVVGKEVKEEGFTARKVWKDEIVLVATPEIAAPFQDEAELSAESLHELPLILREAGSGTRAAALSALEQAGAGLDELHIALEIGGNAAAREAALQGIGAAFLSRFAVDEAIASGRLVILPLPGSPLVRPFVLLTRTGRTLSPAAAELVRLVEGMERA